LKSRSPDAVFQGFRLVKQIVLDKTGTLTEGHPVVREIEAVGVSELELLAVARRRGVLRAPVRAGRGQGGI